MNEATQNFNELKELFKEEGINFNNEIILHKILKEFNNKGDEEIANEINKLIVIFDIKIEREKINDDIHNLILLSNKDKILTVSNAVKIFIEETGALQEEYTKTLNAVINASKDNIEIDFTKMCLDILKSLGIDLFNKNNNFPSILLKFSQNKDVIKFLITKNYEDCRALQEICIYNDDTFLTPADILDFEKCVSFMNSIGTQEEINKMTDYDLIQKANLQSLSENFVELELYLNNFIEHYHQIKEVINKEIDRPEALSQKIGNILKESKFTLSNKGKNYFIGYVSEKLIDLKYLQETRDRVMISKNIFQDSNENLKIKNQKFLEIISEILKIYDKLNEIYSIGYTKEITLQIDLNNYIVSCSFISSSSLSDQSKKEEINITKISSYLNEIINNVKNSQIEGYMKN